MDLNFCEFFFVIEIPLKLHTCLPLMSTKRHFNENQAADILTIGLFCSYFFMGGG